MENQTFISVVCLSTPHPERAPLLRLPQDSSAPGRERESDDITKSQSSKKHSASYTMSPFLVSPDTAISMSPHSPLLLQHYLEETSAFLVAKPASYNPYLTFVIPLAYSDDILMHAVLALSGTQLSFTKAQDYHIHLATRRHYSETLRSLGTLVADQSVCEDAQRALRIALVSLVLCYVEVSSQEG